MIHPAAVAFDIDDVVADTMSLFLEIARRDYRLDRFRHEDITSYMLEECLDIERDVLETILKRIIDGNFSIPLQPLSGAPEVLGRLAAVSRPLLFVTARPRRDAISDWIRRVLGLTADNVEIVATGTFDGKADILQQRRILYFVDDRLETCYALEAAGVTPILFRRPWNRRAHPFSEVGSWHEIEKMIDFDPVESR